MAIRFGKKPEILSIRKQALFIRQRLPGFRTRFDKSTLVATGDIQPCELCDTYEVEVEYRVRHPPRVRVLAPELRRRGDERIPHMYGQEHLCLYDPYGGDWSPDKEIAKTIIPWSSLWLFYYEMWHTTGEWLGGGHEPRDDEHPSIGAVR